MTVSYRSQTHNDKTERNAEEKMEWLEMGWGGWHPDAPASPTGFGVQLSFSSSHRSVSVLYVLLQNEMVSKEVIGNKNEINK